MSFPKLDRWERLLVARGGCKKKKCARYTKPGPRPRSILAKTEQSTLKQLQKPQPKLDPILHNPGVHIYNEYPTPNLDIFETFIGRPYTSATITQLKSVYTNHDTYLSWDTPSSSTITYANSSPFTTSSSIYGSLSSGWIDSVPGTGSAPRIYIQSHVDYGQTGSLIIGKGVLDPLTMKKFELQRKIREQLKGPHIKRNGQYISNVTPEEVVALELLKNLVDTKQWRRYLKYGYILTEGKSGLVYQISRNQSHVIVYRKGKKVSELCVGINSRVPPTDAVIARKIIIEADEKDIWKKANVHHPDTRFKSLALPIRTPELKDEHLIQLAAA